MSQDSEFAIQSDVAGVSIVPHTHMAGNLYTACIHLIAATLLNSNLCV